MGRILPITDYLSHLESSQDPLSADVYFIQGKEFTYIVDVGACEDALERVLGITKKKIIITHFHADHADNLKRIPDDTCIYVGNYTKKSTGKGEVVDGELLIEDEVSLRIYPIPNSHAKGSLCVLVNNEYLIMGDSYYSNIKGYNLSLLHDEISLLRKLDFKYAFMSHDNEPHNREEIIAGLETARKEALAKARE